MSHYPACPGCGCDLSQHAEITLVDWAPTHRPQTSWSADLILACEECGAQFNAFVQLTAFAPIENPA